jgi:predicted transcriptional regulator
MAPRQRLRSTVTEDFRQRLRAASAAGLSYATLARHVGVSSVLLVKLAHGQCLTSNTRMMAHVEYVIRAWHAGITIEPVMADVAAIAAQHAHEMATL